MISWTLGKRWKALRIGKAMGSFWEAVRSYMLYCTFRKQCEPACEWMLLPCRSPQHRIIRLNFPFPSSTRFRVYLKGTNNTNNLNLSCINQHEKIQDCRPIERGDTKMQGRSLTSFLCHVTDNGVSENKRLFGSISSVIHWYQNFRSSNEGRENDTEQKL